MMPKDEFAEAFGELMTKFDENRARWIANNGNDVGFNLLPKESPSFRVGMNWVLP